MENPELERGSVTQFRKSLARGPDFRHDGEIDIVAVRSLSMLVLRIEPEPSKTLPD